jgi:hypothetical protein
MDFERIYPWSSIERYENRIRVSRSVFNFKNVDEATRKKYQRPADQGNVSALIGIDIDTVDADNWLLRKVNADLGKNKKIHVITMLFNANKYSVSEIEEVRAAWQGPNKNELIVCIGIDPGTREIKWCDVFSWMDDTTLHVYIRQAVTGLKEFNAKIYAPVLQDLVPKYWKKKSFKDFEYIKVGPPIWCSIVIYIVSVGIIIAAGFGTQAWLES